jgi:RNA polymerase sigma-70 factor (ECF subfamily)
MRNSDKIVDSLLVLQCQSGNKKAASLLVKRWHKKLCRQANWYVKDSDVSKDIVQDSWTVIFNKIHNIKDSNRFGSWVLSIITRKSIDWLRKNKREVKSLEKYYTDSTSTIDYSSIDSSIDKLKVLRIEIKKLPCEQQAVLHLFYLETYSIREIADILQLPVGTVKSRLFNAREKLKLIVKNRNHEK